MKEFINKRLLFLIAIVAVGTALRLYGLGGVPSGFTPDEAAQGYTAYSIWETGKDEWGNFLPLNLRSFGDFKPPLYTYLSVPFVGLFGLSEFIVRLPSALLGIVAIVFTYLLTKKLTNDTSMALVAALLLAISPWHVPLSRGAFEANVSTALLTGGIYFFLQGLQRPAMMWYAAILLGLNVFSYHSARLVTPAILVLVCLYYRKKILAHYQRLIAPLVLLGMLIAISLGSFVLGATIRVSDVAIYSPTGGWAATADRRYEAVTSGVPDSVARVFSNKLAYVFSTFTDNYLNFFSTEFLFTSGPGEGTYGMSPGRGVLYLFELITIGVAVGAFLLTRRKDVLFLLVWILIAAVPPALAKGYHAANRFAISMPAWQILSAIGLVLLFRYLVGRQRRMRTALLIALVWLGVVSMATFLEDYFVHTPVAQAKAMQYGWREAATYILAHEAEYDEIVVSRKHSEPQAFIAFYLQLDPRTFQQASYGLMEYEREGKTFLDQLGEYKIGKYTFKEIPRGLVPEPQILYVGTFDELHDRPDIIHQVFYPNKESAFIFVKQPETSIK